MSVLFTISTGTLDAEGISRSAQRTSAVATSQVVERVSKAVASHR